MKGMIPPNDVELEQAVLGAMLIDRSGVSEAISILKEENVFYDAKHQIIYTAMLRMFKESKAIDILTLSDELRKMSKITEAGSEIYLIQLTQVVSSSAHIEFHCRVLMQYYVKRKIIQIFSNTIEQSYKSEKDTFELLDDAYKELDRITEWLSMKPSKTFKDHVDELFNEGRTGKTHSVEVALKKMQGKLNGYQNSDLIILAARPAMGKTAYMLNDVLFQAQKGIPIAVFSLEMSSRQCTARLMANYAKINSKKINDGMLNNEEIKRMIYLREDFSKLPIFIEEDSNISFLQLKIKAKKLVRDKGVKAIYIDYLQLMNNASKGKNREQEISEISRGLKGLAKELDVPIIALSQLSRNVESKSGHKRPQLADLRESGAIEQDADIVMFLYRPEYYEITEWDDADKSPTEGEVEVIIGKFRNGTTGETRVKHRLQYMEFSDLEDTYQEPPMPLGSPDMAF